MTVARLNAASLRFKNWLRWSLVCLCVTLAACGGRVDLMGSIPEDEANDVLAALLKENIAAEKVSGKEGMVGVRVDSQQVGRSLEILRANGLTAHGDSCVVTLPPLRDSLLADLVQKLAACGAGVVELTPHTKTLEEIFLSLTSEEAD